jgi:hypothetical protein
MRFGQACTAERCLRAALLSTGSATGKAIRAAPSVATIVGIVWAATVVRVTDAKASGTAAAARTDSAGADALPRLADKIALWRPWIGVAQEATRAAAGAVGLEVDTLLLTGDRAQGERRLARKALRIGAILTSSALIATSPTVGWICQDTDTMSIAAERPTGAVLLAPVLVLLVVFFLLFLAFGGLDSVLNDRAGEGQSA